MKLTFLTGSKNKFTEFQRHFPDLLMLDRDVPEVQSLDPREVIEAKVRYVNTNFPQRVQYPLIVEDTSLTVEAMGGLPGPLIKWFLKGMGSEGLAVLVLKSYENVRAAAHTFIGYSDYFNPTRYFEGVVHGRICLPRGETDFGWDNIFIPEGHKRAFSEMTPEEKDEVSMRGRAIRQLQEFLASSPA